MSDLVGRLRSLLAELRRRRVYTVAASYLVTAFVIVQLAALAAGAFALPSWFEPLAWVLCSLGFPIALFLAWAFELTPTGMQRNVRRAPTSPDDSPGSRSQTVYGLVLGLGLVAAAVVGAWYLTWSGDAEPGAGNRSIAVLPFETLGRSEPTPFTDGIHGDVLTQLANVADLRVISRTSVMRYRNTTEPVPAIARELGVTWILRGEVQESGDEVRVNARLVNTRDDRQVWAESYDTRLTAENLFAIQTEITHRIVRSLEARLTDREREQLARAPTRVIEAYQLHAQGRYLLDRRTRSEVVRSLAFFRRAIEADSTFAAAHSGLADAYLVLTNYGELDEAAGLARAEGAARRALILDPTLGEAHSTLGLLHALRLDAAGAIRAYERATDLRPSHGQSWFWYGLTLTAVGEVEAGWKALRRAVELDPLHPAILNGMGTLEWSRRDLTSAASYFERALDLSPEFSAHNPLAITFAELGRHEEAMASSDRAVELAAPRLRRNFGMVVVRAVTLILGGRAEEGRALLREAELSGERPFWIGGAYAALGETDEAFRWLRRTEWDLYVSWLFSVMPWLDPIRGDPRFDAVRASRNEAWGLNPDGSLPDGSGVILGGTPPPDGPLDPDASPKPPAELPRFAGRFKTRKAVDFGPGVAQGAGRRDFRGGSRREDEPECHTHAREPDPRPGREAVDRARGLSSSRSASSSSPGAAVRTIDPRASGSPGSPAVAWPRTSRPPRARAGPTSTATETTTFTCSTATLRSTRSPTRRRTSCTGIEGASSPRPPIIR